jgi:hypothetical protein
MQLHLLQACEQLHQPAITPLLTPRLRPGIKHSHPAAAVASHSSMPLQPYKAPAWQQRPLLLLLLSLLDVVSWRCSAYTTSAR